MAPRARAGESDAQSTISRFFSQAPKPKRGTTPIDLTLSDDDDASDISHPSKRPKLSGHANVAKPQVQQLLTPKKNYKTKSSVFTLRPPTESPVSKYTFSPHTTNADDDDEVMSESARNTLQTRRDAFRRKLDDRFERREAKALQIAEGETQYDVYGTNGQISERDDQEDTNRDGRDSDSEIQELGEAVTQRLQAFAAPAKSKAGPSTLKINAAEPKTKTKVGSRTKKVEEVGPSGQKYTPLEKQILALKAAHADCLLMFEVGYKMRFFGADAQIVSKELGIARFPDRNFLTAYIPIHRKNVHLKKLISLGHKVGIIGQTETAALKKAGDNKSGPFERELTELYTAATFVDTLDSADDGTDEMRTAPPSLACFVESPGSGTPDQIVIGMVAVVPSTGEVTYDEWEDSHMRTELETRITHIRPSELLIPGGKQLSKSTVSVLEHFTGNKRFNAGRAIRVERFSDLMDSTDAFSLLSTFYHKQKGRSGDVMAAIVDLPKKVQIALAHAIQYLAAFGVAEAFSETTFFSTFSSRSHMLLNGTTLTNLEIFRNSTDFSEKGSLCWILDHTKTKFGSRMLKSWIGRPLTDKTLLKERIDAVQEIIDEAPPAFGKFQSLLKGLPDLAKGLARISYGKCTPKELAGLLTAYQRISLSFDPADPPAFKSPLWNDIVSTLPKLRLPLLELTTIFNLTKARFDQPKADLWLDDEKYPALDDCKYSIAAIEGELDEELKAIRKLLKRPSLNYTSVAGNEYLIEVRHAESKKIPVEWMRVSSTKAVLRYHTPLVKKKLAEREQQRETLAQG
ncbi:Mismatch repair protein msh3 [Tulasnella sp. JGI-2019a]|nr:Mismatch repair protein msh3 [Tulasnella sp. JGI-2019a]